MTHKRKFLIISISIGLAIIITSVFIVLSFTVWKPEIKPPQETTLPENPTPEPEPEPEPEPDKLKSFNSVLKIQKDDSEQNTAMNYAEIDLSPDFSIENVFYNMDAQEGELINLNIGISNIGNVNLSNFKVQAFGQTVETISKVSIGEYSYISVDILFKKNNDVELITVISNGVERNYELRVQYSDIRLNGNVSIKSDKQFFNFVITNVEDQDETVELIVYKGGEIVYNKRITITGASSVEINLDFDNLQVGDNLFCEIITNENDRYQIDNSVVLRSIKDTTIINEAYNPFCNILQIAKGVLYGE